MPYRSNKELPPAVKGALPKAAQDIWRNVANSALADKGTEEKAAASAWAAVKRAGYEKDVKGQWVKVGKAQYQGQTVALNKPFRLPSGSSKKFGVYVKDGDSVKRVTFGDPNMEIRRDDPEARRSFRARHRCDEQKDKTTAAYWSCKLWEAGATVTELTKEDSLGLMHDSVHKEIGNGRAVKTARQLRQEDPTMSNVQFTTEITKIDEDKRLVYAWASVVTKDGEPVADLQGDMITVDELEKAAHQFMLDSREAGDMHIQTTGVGKVVGSMVFTKQLQESLGIDLGLEGWLVTMHIQDEGVWKRVKDGELTMLSIGGRGKRG